MSLASGAAGKDHARAPAQAARIFEKTRRLASATAGATQRGARAIGAPGNGPLPLHGQSKTFAGSPESGGPAPSRAREFFKHRGTPEMIVGWTSSMAAARGQSLRRKRWHALEQEHVVIMRSYTCASGRNEAPDVAGLNCIPCANPRVRAEIVVREHHPLGSPVVPECR